MSTEEALLHDLALRVRNSTLDAVIKTVAIYELPDGTIDCAFLRERLGQLRAASPGSAKTGAA